MNSVPSVQVHFRYCIPSRFMRTVFSWLILDFRSSFLFLQSLHLLKLQSFCGSGHIRTLIQGFIDPSWIALNKSFTFWWYTQKHTLWNPFEFRETHSIGLRSINEDNPIFKAGYFSLNSWYSSERLASRYLFCLASLFPEWTFFTERTSCWLAHALETSSS